MQSLTPILEKLKRSQNTFLRAAEPIPVESWIKKPGPEIWSAGEVVAHLIMVEESVVSYSNRVIQHTPKRISLWNRQHLPLWIVEARIVKRKSPIALNSALVSADKQKMLGDLQDTRNRALEFLEATQSRDLSTYRWNHAFLGSLSLYEWFEMIAAHQARHAKQLKQIEGQLLKVV